MTRKDKLLQKIKNNPRSASFGDVRQLLIMERTKEYYMALDYPVQIERVAGGFCAFISMLKGCKAFGETPDQAYQEVEASLNRVFRSVLTDGQADSRAGGASGCAISGLSATGESRGAEAVRCVSDFVGISECIRCWPISSLPSLTAGMGEGSRPSRWGSNQVTCANVCIGSTGWRRPHRDAGGDPAHLSGDRGAGAQGEAGK